MDDEDEKKKAKQEKRKQWGETVFNVIHYGKYLANPIVLYAVIIILILLLAIGVISYMVSIPGRILGKVEEFFQDLIGSDSIIIKDEEVLDLAEYIEEMGYDLEAYGFVETITRTGEKTYEDEEYDNNTPTRGEIKAINSRYLRAYIAAEKKMYMIANPERPWYQVFFQAIFQENEREFIIRCRDVAAEEVLELKWQMGTAIIPEFESAFNELYELDGNVYKLKESAKTEIKKSKYGDIWNFWLFGGYVQEVESFPAEEKDTQIRHFIRVFLIWQTDKMSKGYVGSKYSFPVIRTELPGLNITAQRYVDMDQAIYYIIGEAIASKSGMLDELIQLRNYYYEKTYITLDKGTGRIVLEDNKKEFESNSQQDWALTEDEAAQEKPPHHVSINKDKRTLIIHTDMKENGGFWDEIKTALGLNSLSTYYYNLEGWTDKYGMSTDFLIAMHVATQAPDFAYKLATEGMVDSKIHINLFDIIIEMELYPEKDGETTILSMLENLNTDSEAVSIFKEIIYSVLETGIDPYSTWIINPSTTPGVFTASQLPASEGLSSEVNSSEYNEDLGTLIITLPMNANEDDIKYVKSVLSGVYTLEELKLWASRFLTNSAYNDVISRRFISVPDLEQLGLISVYELLDPNEGLIAKVKEWQQPMDTAIPYITKVINHWFRNNYFTNLGDENGEDLKDMMKNLINNMFDILNRVSMYNSEGLNILKNTILNNIDSINSKEETISYARQLRDQLQELVDAIDNSDDEQARLKKNLQNQIDSLTAQVIGGFSGGAYRVNGTPEALWYSLAEVSERAGSIIDTSTACGKLFALSWVKEQRNMDLYQIHNPLFEDNSRYVRTWLKDKYYIFDGETDNRNVESGSSETTGTALSNNKLLKGMEYIDGKKALEKIKEELKSCESNGGYNPVEYMLRDAMQLFEDFEFDLENQNIPAEKELSNILPDYKPYTTWPSIYEKADANCTKIIFKTTNTHRVVAPADAVVDAVGTNFIQLKFEDVGSSSTTIADMILRISAENGGLILQVDEGDHVTRGEQIGYTTSSSYHFGNNPSDYGDAMVILKLNLFTATKQLVKVENYMSIERKSYEEMNSSEAKGLRCLLASEFYDEDASTETTRNAEYIATLNTVFNKIASPYVSPASSVETVLNNAVQYGYLKYSKLRVEPSGDELDRINTAIKNAMSGGDITKEYTVIGATGYYGGVKIDSKNNVTELYYTEEMGDTSGFKDERDNLRIKVQLGNRIFGLTEEEYNKYLRTMINKKLDEIIYSLDVTKLILGTSQIPGMDEANPGEPGSKLIEEWEDLLARFENAKNDMIEYYSSGKFLEECGGIKKEYLATVTSLMKTEIKDELKDESSSQPSENGGEDGNRDITNTFVLMANANYSVRWKWKYTVNKEGKIISDVVAEHFAIKNY